MPSPSSDLELLRYLLRERRLEVAVLQQLRAAPDLGRALIEGGLLSPVELSTARAALARGEAPGLGRIGEYELTARLGQGGMGAVFAGRHVVTGARRAIKVATALHGTALERFHREGQAQAQVDGHRNVLKVFGSGKEGHQHFLVMELAEGGDLQQRLADGPLTIEEAPELVAELADGLQHVHEHGILHRDIKPANILFNAAGVPLLVDFGLALLLDAETLTQTQALLGTPAYMAPEQVRGAHKLVDARTDVYALGAVLYECLTGEYMFSSSGGLQVIAHVLHSPPNHPQSVRPEVPAWLCDVVFKALAKDPADRFQTARAFAEALRAGERLAPPRRGGRGRLLAAGAIVLAVLLGGGLWLRSRAQPSEPTRATASGVADLATRIHAGLHRTGSLRQDGADLERLRAELLALEGERSELQRAQLRRAEYELLVWEGLEAAARGTPPQDQTERLTQLNQLAQRVKADDPEFAIPSGARALQALVQPESLEAAPTALAASGLERPELQGWVDQAHLRHCHRALEQGDTKLAFEILLRVRRLEEAPAELTKALLDRGRRLLVEAMSALRKHRPNTKNSAEIAITSTSSLVKLLLKLDPKTGLTRPQFDELLAYATVPARRVFWLGPSLAAFAPNDLQYHLRMSNHWKLLDRSTRCNRKLVAGGYLQVLERAYELARPGVVRVQAGLAFCDALRLAELPDRCQEVSTQLLKSPNVVGTLRAELLSIRGVVRGQQRDYAAAHEDFDASLALNNLPLTHARKAILLWQAGLRGDKPSVPAATRAGITAIRADLSRTRGREERSTYPLTILVIYGAIVRSHRDYELGVEAINHLLGGLRSQAGYGGWFLRRAYLRLRTQRPDVAAAIKDLERALALIPDKSRMAPLRPKLEAALAKVRKRGARARRAVWKVCASLRKLAPEPLTFALTEEAESAQLPNAPRVA